VELFDQISECFLHGNNLKVVTLASQAIDHGFPTDEIGTDGYSNDAAGTVDLVKRLTASA